MKIQVTAHAVDRYVDRIDDRATQAEAKVLIEHAMTVATRQRTKTHSGHTRFQAGDLRLIVAEEAGRAVVVTVLGPNDPGGAEAEEVIPELAMELAAEYRAGLLKERPAAMRAKTDPGRHVVTIAKLEAEAAAARKRAKKAEGALVYAQASHFAELARWKAKYERQVAHAALMLADKSVLHRLVRRLLAALLRTDTVASEPAIAEVEAALPGLVEHVRAGIEAAA